MHGGHMRFLFHALAANNNLHNLPYQVIDLTHPIGLPGGKNRKRDIVAVAAVIIGERDPEQSKPLILIAADASPFILSYLGRILFQLGNFNVMSAMSAQECMIFSEG